MIGELFQKMKNKIILWEKVGVLQVTKERLLIIKNLFDIEVVIISQNLFLTFPFLQERI